MRAPQPIPPDPSHPRRLPAWLHASLGLLAAVALAVGLPGCTTHLAVPPASPLSAPPFTYLQQRLTQPRLLRLHAVRFDRSNPDYELVSVLSSEDPDGPGPAHVRLARPEQIVANAGLVAAVNANAFAALPDAAGRTPSGWSNAQPVRIIGAATTGGQTRSPPDARYTSVWTDPSGRLQVDNVREIPNCREAAAGFSRVLADGRNLCSPQDRVLHPRSAVGFEPGGRFVWLVVVDGRQSGYSEGVSTYELAELMRDLGCATAANLDGGGSSALFAARTPGARVGLCNRPSGGETRPVPVMLGIRPRALHR